MESFRRNRNDGRKSDSRRRSVFLFKTRWNARSTDFADEMSSRDKSGRATTRYEGIGDRTIVEGVTEGRKKTTRVCALTSVAALHPARMTAVLIRIQYILGCILSFVIAAGPIQEPPDRSRRRFCETKWKEIRVRSNQEETTKKIHRSNNATHTTLIDEPRDTEGASIGLSSPSCRHFEEAWAPHSGRHRKSAFLWDYDYATILRELFEFCTLKTFLINVLRKKKNETQSIR